MATARGKYPNTENTTIRDGGWQLAISDGNRSSFLSLCGRTFPPVTGPSVCAPPKFIRLGVRVRNSSPTLHRRRDTSTAKLSQLCWWLRCVIRLLGNIACRPRCPSPSYCFPFHVFYFSYSPRSRLLEGIVRLWHLFYFFLNFSFYNGNVFQRRFITLLCRAQALPKHVDYRPQYSVFRFRHYPYSNVLRDSYGPVTSSVAVLFAHHAKH